MNNREPKMLMSNPRLLTYLFVQNHNSICLCVCCKENLDLKKKKKCEYLKYFVNLPYTRDPRIHDDATFQIWHDSSLYKGQIHDLGPKATFRP